MGDVIDPDRLEQIRQQQAEQALKSGQENARGFFERQQRTNGGNGGQREAGVGLQVQLNEDGIALAFAQRHRDSLRYDHTRGAW